MSRRTVGLELLSAYTSAQTVLVELLTQESLSLSPPLQIKGPGRL